jgi:hypothetical protein
MLCPYFDIALRRQYPSEVSPSVVRKRVARYAVPRRRGKAMNKEEV